MQGFELLGSPEHFEGLLEDAVTGEELHGFHVDALYGELQDSVDMGEVPHVPHPPKHQLVYHLEITLSNEHFKGEYLASRGLEPGVVGYA